MELIHYQLYKKFILPLFSRKKWGKMKYGIKPTAGESKAHMLTLPCMDVASYSGHTASSIVLGIQYNPSVHYIDPSTTKIEFTFIFVQEGR